MNEAVWYKKQIEQLGEALWQMQQQFRTLQDYRKDNQRLWNDNAAYEINGRYLNPHEKSYEQILQALQQQQTLLQKVHTLLTSVERHIVEISELSEEISRLLGITQEELQRSYSNYDMFITYHLEAKSGLREVYQLINQANKACN
ncbi:MAG: hypothetical protein AAFV71_25875 [Cyanobacteria bacterium J06633_8]